MTATGKPVGQLLLYSILFLLFPGGVLPCSNLTVDSPVIMGTMVTASCTIWKNRCPVRLDEDVQILWKLDEEFLPGVQYRVSSNGVEMSNITIGPLNRTVTTLNCYVKRNKTFQFMNMTRIHAGYPPSQPHNLSCVLNFTTMNLMCQWESQQIGLFSGSSVTLTGYRSWRDCSARLEPIAVCHPPVTQNFCTIPRTQLKLYQSMIFQVTIKNDLGVAQSEPLCADPMDLVKLDPPSIQDIQSIPEETDCVAVEWDAVRADAFRHICDMRYRIESNQEWISIHNITSPPVKTLQCGFHLGTHYQFQMRCRKFPLGYWSDWSATKNFTTHEKVPSGELDSWWKVKPNEDEKGLYVHLLWKPMKPNETNGRILGYRVTLHSKPYHHQSLPGLCDTTETHCRFLLPPGNRRINLMAYNGRGLSPPTAILLFEKDGQPVSNLEVHPQNENQFQVYWNPPGPPTTGYVVEWHKSCGSLGQSNDNNISWTKVQSGDITQALIQENIEPFQRYNISVYALYRDGVGRVQYVEAYTAQKAPSEAPKLQAGSISKSTAELLWKPIPVEKQNGFITNYTIFWMGTNDVLSSAVLSSSLNKFTITGLRPSRMYRVHIMASTVAGSANGTVVNLYTKALDDVDILIVYTLVGLLLVMIIILIICFQKSKRMKTQFWPSVPDPANSSLGKWAPGILQEEISPAPKSCELSPAILSAILVIEADEKKCLSCGKSEPILKTVEDGPTASSGLYPPRPASYQNVQETLQYATVIGENYRSQEETSSFYMRSNSSQPLLSDVAHSPKPYENLCFHNDTPHRECGFQDEGVFLDKVLIDFPLLQGLKISGDEDLNQFRKL